METNESRRAPVAFAALDPYIESHIVKPTETVIRGKDLVLWGERNLYPDYLLELTKTSPTLRSVINGTVDFIKGDAQTIEPLAGYAPGIMNLRGDTIAEQVEDVARDWETYGGLALQVIRNAEGSVAEVYHLPVRFLRSNKENTVFYYSEEWKKGTTKYLVYTAFLPGLEKRWALLSDEERNRHASSVLFVKNDRSQVYPFPPYGAAVKSCETERCIADFHYNGIRNGFAPSAIVNFNNGVPTDEIKKEIADDMEEKFSGNENAGRMLVSWNDDRAHAATFEVLKTEDFGEKYQALEKSSRQQIFTAFRANPNLFGIPTESLGFSEEEYASAFRLYNRTAVRPVQRIICDAYDKIYGRAGVLTIKPFSLEETATEQAVK
jgi:hypothetical protein